MAKLQNKIKNCANCVYGSKVNIPIEKWTDEDEKNYQKKVKALKSIKRFFYVLTDWYIRKKDNYEYKLERNKNKILCKWMPLQIENNKTHLCGQWKSKLKETE